MCFPFFQDFFDIVLPFLYDAFVMWRPFRYVFRVILFVVGTICPSEFAEFISVFATELETKTNDRHMTTANSNALNLIIEISPFDLLNTISLRILPTEQHWPLCAYALLHPNIFTNEIYYILGRGARQKDLGDADRF